MSCKKRKYRDHIAAKLALTSTGKKDQRRTKNEIRYYKCNICKYYHLTSQEYRPRELLTV